MKFLIWAWDYGTDSGGGIALHRLAHNLTELGHVVYLTCDRTAPGWRGIPIGSWSLGRSVEPATVVVYPEIVEGNPWGGQRVVRWILNVPGFFGSGNGDGIYGERDLVMLWKQSYLASLRDDKRVGGLLAAWRDLSHFRDYHRPRAGACYLVRKGRFLHIPTDKHPADALCIDDYGMRGGDQYLIDTFNSRESFWCYDDNCLIPTLARFCGVPEIRMPFGGDPVLSRAEYQACVDLSAVQTREFVALCERWWA